MFAGATWDFFGHGYAVLTGLLTVALFSLAGAARLQAKTDGALRDQVGAIVRPLTLASVAGVAISAALISLSRNTPITPDLATAIQMTGADIAQNELGLIGKGVRVAVMDSGIDYNHPDLGGCFS